MLARWHSSWVSFSRYWQTWQCRCTPLPRMQVWKVWFDAKLWFKIQKIDQRAKFNLQTCKAFVERALLAANSPDSRWANVARTGLKHVYLGRFASAAVAMTQYAAVLSGSDAPAHVTVTNSSEHSYPNTSLTIELHKTKIRYFLSGGRVHHWSDLLSYNLCWIVI